ncbi:hypothetical protein LB523_24835 [Mesorhizobium sp. ESP-6-4]|uniref:NACHT domain-containing protein n=1 Tax=Mesorhizobium sp. ESP-6-4 TaxID=2876624 RepID=UPI001CCDFB1F|nr:NACHT domain-containing protein [Mesorhizobium sp. ESP-6-4]MBZ9662280.1 hypothetical protein [Mesorhizobium sp. ESP-6-4]
MANLTGAIVVLEENPEWLRLPASSTPGSTPVQTNKQDLPYGELTWEDYERLCFRLAQEDAEVEYCALYGRQGQPQEGIDVFSRKSGGLKYSCWQAKRHKSVTAAKIKTIVKEFLKGGWVEKTDCFYVCFQAPIQDTKIQKEIEEQSTILKNREITFIPIGSVEMSLRLKRRCDLVLDFFGREWAIAFCGIDAVSLLGERLDGFSIAKLRAELLSIYSGCFQALDPGVGSIPIAGTYRPLSLLNRFIEPDVAYSESLVSIETEKQGTRNHPYGRDVLPESQPIQSSIQSISPTLIRRPLSNWVSEGNQVAILAPGGFGKSSFLRALALDLLTQGKLFPELTRRWGDRIPIYLPFATWTRLFSDGTADVSLSDAIKHWFKRFEPSEELQRLILDSLKDNRLLLLLDGLDEGTNPQASRSARTLLDAFVKTHAIDAVLTSRPSGIDRLGALDPMWRVGRVAELTKAQQKKLAQVWFTHLKPPAGLGSKTNDEAYEHLIHREVEDFFRTLSGRGILEPLAGIPLLLTGLTALALRQVSLPRSRFEAYDELVKLLLDEHPKRRASAAQHGIARSIVLAEPALVRGALSYLAYKCRETGATPGIGTLEARRHLVEYLQSMDGAGLPSQSAISAASELLTIDAETTGLLVQRSPDEIGFLHGVFEEYLAGCHAATLVLDDQKKLIIEKSGDERWSNVLLSMLRSIRRRSEVEMLVAAARKAATDPVGRMLTLRLATEVAFGDFSCPASYAQELATETFDVIEMGSWLSERSTLLSIVLELGWNSPNSARLKEKLEQWFPNSIQYRQNVYLGMADWPHDNELKHCLWRGLFADDLANKRAASVALSRTFNNDESLGDRLATLVRSPVDPETASAALLALQNGWRGQSSLPALTAEAKASASIPILLTGLRCSVAQKSHTDADLDLLIDLAKRVPGRYQWVGDIIPALIEGWPNDDRIYSLVAQTIRTDTHSGPLDKDIANSYALHAAQFDDIKDAEVSEAIKRDKFFLRGLGESRLRPGNYRKHVLAAIDYRIENTDVHFNNDVAHMAVIAKTPAAKARLLNDLQEKDRWIFWPVWGLLQGWGMTDFDVAAALTSLLVKPIEEQALFAHYIPDIEFDRAKAKQRLVEIAKLPELGRPDILVRGFKKLGATYADNDVVELLLKHSFAQRGVFDATGDLISGFGLHPKVKELARQRIEEIDCPWASLVEAYGNDPEFRALIFSRLGALPASLRSHFVSIASMKTADNIYLERLARWPLEEDREIRTQASIAYNGAIKLDQQRLPSAIKYLKKETTSIGPWMDQRRQAGLVGLIALGREDIFATLQPDHGQSSVDVELYYPENRIAVAYLARNWKSLSEALSDQLFDRLSRHGSNEWHVWQLFAPYISESSAVRDAFVSYCTQETKLLSSQAFEALSRVSPRSALLQEHCERLLADNGPIDVNSTSLDVERRNIILGQVIARQFQSNINYRLDLERLSTRGNTAGILGLCQGWPELPILKDLLEKTMEMKWRSHYFSHVSALYLTGTVGTTAQFKLVLSSLLQTSEGDPWSFLEYCVPPTVDRLKRDPQLVSDSLRAISGPNADFKASMPRLLSSAIGLTDELRDLCGREVTIQHSRKSIPLCGLDIVSGKIRPVSDALMDTLVPAGT